MGYKAFLPFLIRNWHPILLLNCDYKIVIKAIVNHAKNFSTKADRWWSNWIYGWFIGDNIWLSDGLINYTTEENLPWPLFFLDFVKAYGIVEWHSFKQRLVTVDLLCKSTVTSRVVPENIQTPTTEGISNRTPPTPSDFPFSQGNVNPPPLWNFHRNIAHPPYPLESFFLH